MAIVTLDGGQSSKALGGQVIEYITNLVLMQIPGAPDQLVTAQLAQVLRDFYMKSTAWREDLGPYAVRQNQNLVKLNPVDQNSRLQFVMDAWLYPYEGANLPNQLIVLTRQPYGGEVNPPTRYYMKEMDQLYLYPTPDKDYGKIIYVRGALVPLSTAAVLPDVSYTHHLDALQYGVLARMHAMTKKPWSDKVLAQQYRKDYVKQIMMFRDIAERGNGPADTPFQYPRFANVRGASQLYQRAVR